MQTAATFITIFLCVGTWLLCVNIIPDLFGLSPDSFIAFVVVYPIAFGLMCGICMIMKPFFPEKPDRKKNERKKYRGS